MRRSLLHWKNNSNMIQTILGGTAKITKKNAILIDDYYCNTNTSTITFQFDSQHFPSSESKLRKSLIKHGLIDGKDLYIVDHFFQEVEGEEMRSFSQKTTFSRNSYGSPEAIEKGEKPARSMNGKERWQFFAKPPNAIHEVYKLFSTLGDKLNAEITTLPWELCDPSLHGSPAVIANKLEEASEDSRELGKHQDCNPAGRISFGIPILYSKIDENHPSKFINGEKGRPWLFSVMLYTTAANFSPDHGLGTVFYDDRGEIVFRSNCLNMRLVLFQGDIFHSIEESTIPKNETTWRISYVFKLILNPRDGEGSIKENLANFIKKIAPIQPIQFGPHLRG